MTMGETPITLTMHGVTLGAVLLILGLMFKQHSVWVRMKDRLNTLWRKHCIEKGDEYVPLDNGHK